MTTPLMQQVQDVFDHLANVCDGHLKTTWNAITAKLAGDHFVEVRREGEGQGEGPNVMSIRVAPVDQTVSANADINEIEAADGDVFWLDLDEEPARLAVLAIEWATPIGLTYDDLMRIDNWEKVPEPDWRGDEGDGEQLAS